MPYTEQLDEKTMRRTSHASSVAEQGDRLHDVVGEVAVGDLHRLARGLVGGEVDRPNRPRSRAPCARRARRPRCRLRSTARPAPRRASPNSMESSTTTSRPAACNAPDRLRADVAGAAGDQDRHQAPISAPSHGSVASEALLQLDDLRLEVRDELATGLRVHVGRRRRSLNGSAFFTVALRQPETRGQLVDVRLRRGVELLADPRHDLFRGIVRAASDRASVGTCSARRTTGGGGRS